MHNGDDILGMLEANSKKIRKFGVKKLGLFGSYVREEQMAESDIDILVEFERGKKSFDSYMELKFFLESLFGCKVDLVINDAIKPSLRRPFLSGVKYAAGL